MRESPIERSHVELSVGDSVRMDDQILTVLDISDDEVIFRVETAADFASGNVYCHSEDAKRLPPR